MPEPAVFSDPHRGRFPSLAAITTLVPARTGKRGLLAALATVARQLAMMKLLPWKGLPREQSGSTRVC